MASVQTCSICRDTVEADKLGLDCGHEFCRNCLVQWFVSKVDERVLNFNCLTCQVPIEKWFIQAVLPSTSLEKFERYELEHVLQAEFILFHCPNKECQATVAVESEAVRHVDCPECKKEYCFSCKVEWHKGITCAKYQEWAKENGQAEALTFSMLRRGVGKQCPKCKEWITKDGGCDHMTCTKCRYQFWWSTLEPYPRGRSNWDLEENHNGPIENVNDVILAAPPPAIHLPWAPSRPSRPSRVFLGQQMGFRELSETFTNMRQHDEVKVQHEELIRNSSTTTTTTTTTIRPVIQLDREEKTPIQVLPRIRKEDVREVKTIDDLFQLFLGLNIDDQAQFVTIINRYQQSLVPEGPYTRERLGLFTMVQLRSLCTRLGLSKTGVKMVLIERILSNILK